MSASRRTLPLAAIFPVPADVLSALGRTGPRFDRLLDELAEPFLPLPVDGDDGARFVCPFCGQAYADSRPRCDRCDGRPVVGADERAVYDRIVALCGPRYDPSSPAARSGRK